MRGECPREGETAQCVTGVELTNTEKQTVEHAETISHNTETEDKSEREGDDCD